MSKKKQVSFQRNIPGKFIPRDDQPAAPVLRAGANNTRFNAKMAELLAASSSSAVPNNENESPRNALRSPTDDSQLPPAIDTALSEPPRGHSRLIQRRIVTMLEALRGRGGTGESNIPLTSLASPFETKSQPITFGQLRQATALSGPPAPAPTPTIAVTEHASFSHTNPRVDAPPMPADRTQWRHSTSPEQLLDQRTVSPPASEHVAEQSKPPLTVDEVVATYYAKFSSPAPPLAQPLSYRSNSSTSHFHSSALVWTPPAPLNEPVRTRPPPPSYSTSINAGLRPPLPSPPLIIVSTPSMGLTHSGRLPQASALARPPPPRYELPMPVANIERSHSALSSMDRPKQSSGNQPQAGFDREFSRLLYGKEGGKRGHHRQKRKAFSDPVKRSVEEAGQTVEKAHRRLTTHLNKADTVKEEEEASTSSDSYEVDKQRLVWHRHLPKSDSARKPIVPANPILSRHIPVFLVDYSKSSPSNEAPIQWHLCDTTNLQSHDAMLRKLYKDENLARVNLFETYRALLTTALASKSTSKREQDDDYITTAL